MTKQLSLLTTAAALLTVIACAPPPEPPPEIDIEAERAALSDAANRYHEALHAWDVDTIAALYASDALVLPPNSETKEGAAGVREFLAAFSSIPGLQVRAETPTVVVSKGGDLGYTLANLEITVDGADGEPVTAQERDFHLWKKQADGSWKVVIDIWNSPVPLSGE
jgi:ketosteroid isomerase-like protein